MPAKRFVRAYQPVDAGDLVRTHALLEAAGYVDYSIENENYFHASGGLYSLGHTGVWVVVAEDDAEAVTELLS